VLDSWIEWLEVDESAPPARASVSTARALAVRYQERSISELAALPWASSRRCFEPGALRPRGRDRARHRRGAAFASLVPRSGGPLLSFARPLGADASPEARRSASASSSQLGSNLPRRVLHPGRTTIGLHPRDNKILLDTLGSSGERQTPLWWSSTTGHHPRASHVIDLGPGAVSRAAASSPKVPPTT